MCERAPIQDPEIKELCELIIASQQAEIDQRQAKLRELDQQLHKLGKSRDDGCLPFKVT